MKTVAKTAKKAKIAKKAKLAKLANIANTQNDHDQRYGSSRHVVLSSNAKVILDLNALH